VRVIFGGPEFRVWKRHDHPPRVRDRLGHVPARRAPRERFGSAQHNPPLRRASTRQKSAFQLDQCRASSSRILRSWSVTRVANAASPRSSAKHSGWTERPGVPRRSSIDGTSWTPIPLWHVFVQPRSDAGPSGLCISSRSGHTSVGMSKTRAQTVTTRRKGERRTRRQALTA